MALALRSTHDAAPRHAPLRGLVVRRETDPVALALLQGRTVGEMTRRFDDGHRAYVAWLGGERAAWGWVATRRAEVGEVGASIVLPAGERYLWNFVTLPAHRGMGIYPRLLEAIIAAESAEAERFWILYAPENHASAAGIRKAGFFVVAELSFDPTGRPAVQGRVEGGESAAARVLGLPVASAELDRCWRCARARKPVAGSCSAESRCACDYQRAESGCAAWSS